MTESGQRCARYFTASPPTMGIFVSSEKEAGGECYGSRRGVGGPAWRVTGLPLGSGTRGQQPAISRLAVAPPKALVPC